MMHLFFLGFDCLLNVLPRAGSKGVLGKIEEAVEE